MLMTLYLTAVEKFTVTAVCMDFFFAPKRQNWSQQKK